jgi:hypothetical protein
MKGFLISEKGERCERPTLAAHTLWLIVVLFLIIVILIILILLLPLLLLLWFGLFNILIIILIPIIPITSRTCSTPPGSRRRSQRPGWRGNPPDWPTA